MKSIARGITIFLLACSIGSCARFLAGDESGMPPTDRQAAMTKATKDSQVEVRTPATQQPMSSADNENQTTSPSLQADVFVGTGQFIDRSVHLIPNAAKESNGSYTLNFQGTEIHEVTRTILGDILNAAYVIDDKVKGLVNLQTSDPISADSLVPTLEALLRMKGAVLVQSGGLYKIVPEGQALSAAISPQTRLVRDKGFQILAVPLRYLAAEEMEKILSPLQQSKNTLQVDRKRNLLIMSGTQDELESMLRTVKVFDINQLKGMSVGLFKLASVDAGSIVDELKEIFSGDSNNVAGGMLKFTQIERLNSVLVLTPQPEYLEEVQTWITRLDQTEEGSGIGLHVYFVQNSQASRIAELLDQLFPNQDTTGTTPTSSRNQTAGVAPGTKPAIIQSKSLTNPSRFPAGSSSISGGSTPGEPQKDGELNVGYVKFIADENNNAIVIKASLTDYAKIEKVIQKLDILPLQVLIETTIADVTLSDELSLGVEWFFKNELSNYSGKGLLDLSASGIGPVVPGFSYSIVDSSDILRGVLNTLASESRATIISSPSLMVLDNHTAEIRVGDQVPVRTSEASSIAQSGDNNTIIASTIQYRDTGVILTVTPRVNISGMVVLDITQDVNDVAQTTTSGIDSPTINQRRIQTTVAVNSGDSIALGGLIREGTTDSTSGIPGLRNLPGIGWLFRSNGTRTTRTEALVLISPTVIGDRNKARSITEEYRDRMKNLSDFFPAE
ncbi:MAG: type II secretion system secretin GspD [Gammaproteobacteria bacterium]|nr:type II secretion system secretin GspD [Gammaproteobacteria bacterium]